MARADSALALRHAVALGLLQGPTELLPISSSAHTTLVPWLAGWPYAQLERELRRSFEVALHTGAGLALALAMRGELHRRPRASDAALLVLSSAPPALAGLLLGRVLERRLGGPRSIAVGLAVGAVAMAIADAEAPQGTRTCSQAGLRDGLALGIAQAAALAPGVSRSGAALTAARARGFSRSAAHSLCWAVALPVIAGASLLQGSRLLRAGVPARFVRPLLAGLISAFCSTLASAALLRGSLSERPLLPYSLYRCLLAAGVLARLRRSR